MNPTGSNDDPPPPLPPRPPKLQGPQPGCSPAPPLPPKPQNSPTGVVPTSPKMPNKVKKISNASLVLPPFPGKAPQLPPKSSAVDKEKMQTRTNAVKELINNEKLFHKQMSYVCELFSNNQIDVPISTDDLSAVKLNLDSYVDCSAAIIKAYENAVAEAPSNELYYACVGRHLMPVMQTFCQVLIDYIKEFDPQILEHRPLLENYFKKADMWLQAKEGKMTTLLDHLHKPFQRPFHVMGILDRLKKHTPESHADYAYVNEANKAIQKACDDADACKRKDAEYTSVYPDDPQGDSALDENGDLEDNRVAYYRKKQKKLSLLIDSLSKWVETYSKDLKSVIETRRYLIKASRDLLMSLDSVKKTKGSPDNNWFLISHRIEKFNPEKFDQSTEYVLDRLKSVSAPLKRLKTSMKRLKGRSKGIVKAKTLQKYKEDEGRAMKVVEATLNRTESVIKNLFLYYMYNIYELLLFNATYGIVEQYASHKEWISKSDVKKRLEENVNTWKMQIGYLQGSGNATHGHATHGHATHGTTLLPPVGRARVLFSYADKQTAVILNPGDTVDVIRWFDELGNTAYALIRVGNSTDFFYPSDRLQPI
ncbi:hypothetical protein Aperf_G00000089961 [Anoplocephala perfoliata]